MDTQPTPRYDPVTGDLSLDLVPRYASQVSDEIELIRLFLG